MKDGGEVKRLGEVCQIDPPKSEARQKLSSSDNVSFVPMSDLGEGQKHFEPKQVRQLSEVVGSYTYFSNNDVLLAKITPCFENGKLGIARNLTNGLGFGSSEYLVLRPSSALSPDYLYYFLNQASVRQAGALVMSGAVGHKRVPKDFVENLTLYIPPLPEQKRIVAILDEAFAGIAAATANAEKNLANARELFEGYLQSVFTQTGEGWVEKILGEVCEFENGDRGKNYPNREEYVEAGIPWINTGHIRPDGSLSETEMNFITPEKYQSLRSGKIRPGDLVYCLRGATLGKTALVDPLTKGAVASSLVIIRPKSLIDSRFLYYFLTSPPGQRLIKLYDNGTAQPNLGAKSVAKYRIRFPKLDEQKSVAGKIQLFALKTKRLEENCRQRLAALNEVKEAILQKAFSGKLTAPPKDALQEEAA